MENSTVTAATKEHHLFDMERKLELTLTENKMLKEANAKLKVQFRVVRVCEIRQTRQTRQTCPSNFKKCLAKWFDLAGQYVHGE